LRLWGEQLDFFTPNSWTVQKIHAYFVDGDRHTGAGTFAGVDNRFSKRATKMPVVSTPARILVFLLCECATGVRAEPFSKIDASPLAKRLRGKKGRALILKQWIWVLCVHAQLLESTTPRSRANNVFWKYRQIVLSFQGTMTTLPRMF